MSIYIGENIIDRKVQIDSVLNADSELPLQNKVITQNFEHFKYQPVVTITSGDIVLEDNPNIYYLRLNQNITFTFNILNLSLTNRAFTFELLIHVDNSALNYTVTFPSGIKWLDDELPEIYGTGYYFFAFRRLKDIWYGCLQGKWGI